VDVAALAELNGGQLAPSLRTAARFLATTTPASHLDAVLESHRGIEAILPLVRGLDHVGFIAPAEVAPGLGEAAAAAGFDLDQHTFASTILARQLADLARREEVPTTIFKARGALADGDPMTVEVAMPRDVDDEHVREWIGQGIGTHVALRVSSPSAFDELPPLLSQEGYRMPRFADGQALTNPVEGLEAVFFDRRPTDPVGLEFCHYD
jgi:hypothetical protein